MQPEHTPEGKIVTGAHGEYHWVEWPDGCLWDLIEAVPELVLGKFLVNTSYDSGFITLSSEARAKGWLQFLPSAESAHDEKEDSLNLLKRIQRATLSPRISQLEEIPYDQYDEWYIYPEAVSALPFEGIEVFINWCWFSLHDPSDELWQNRFWPQLSDLKAETYLAEGGANLICVTRNIELFQKISQWEPDAE